MVSKTGIGIITGRERILNFAASKSSSHLPGHFEKPATKKQI
jgi:hypothetical protein